MTNKTRKITLLILIVACFLLLLAFTACASKANEPKLVYTLSNDGSYYIVSGISGQLDRVEIVSTYENLPVRAIAKDAFKNSKIKEVVIYSGVRLIESGAFRECKNLESVVLPNSIEKIGDYAFYMDTKLKQIDIPDNTKSIGDYAFYNCIAVNEFSFGEGFLLEEIGDMAFWHVGGIKEIKIPSGVKSIGQSAFSGVKTAKSVTIPSSVTIMGDMAFLECVNVDSLSLGSGLSSLSKKAFYGCANLKSLSIPSNVKVIDDMAFCDCKSLESVSFFEGLNEIGNSAFYGCEYLKELNLPSTVTKLGNNAFESCFSLESVNLNKVLTLGDECFKVCDSLTNLIIPSSTTKIGSAAFNGCAKIEQIEFASGQDALEVGIACFMGLTKLKSIVIPQRLKNIPESMFENCVELEKVTFEESVALEGVQSGIKSIGELAFACCESIKEISLPKSLMAINGCAFENCSALEKISLGAKIEEIGFDAFSECTALKSVDVADFATWCNIEMYNYSANPMCYASQLTILGVKPSGEFVVPDNIYNIPAYTFKNSDITSIVFSSTVSEIGECAFYGSKLTKINIPATITKLGYEAFSFTTDVEEITVESGSLNFLAINNCLINKNNKSLLRGAKTSVIPDDASVISIDAYAFSGITGLTAITIPTQIQSIGENAFKGCSSLNLIKYQGTSEQFDAVFKAEDWCGDYSGEIVFG